MKNSIKVSIPFSFKGVEHSPSVIIDLDDFILSGKTLDSLYHHVATTNKIDSYSYEYEILESSLIAFSAPTGIAGDFLSKNEFNLEGFKKQRSKNNTSKQLHIIAKETMNIENLDEHEILKQALLQAYEAGKKSA
jgi:hypothetical protein